VEAGRGVLGGAGVRVGASSVFKVPALLAVLRKGLGNASAEHALKTIKLASDATVRIFMPMNSRPCVPAGSADDVKGISNLRKTI
jgi:hypothetical protein